MVENQSASPADAMAQAQLAAAQGQVEAAWAAVTATWVGAALSALVLLSAFVTILWQRHLDRERAERLRQYNNLSLIVEAMFTINYIQFCAEYMGLALQNGKSVRVLPIIFHLDAYSRSLDLSSAADDVGPGPTGVASRAIVVAREVVKRVQKCCPEDTFTVEQLGETRDFIDSIGPDLGSVWEALQHHYQNITSTPDGQWAVEEFCRRSRTPEGGRRVMDQLKAGTYVSPAAAPTTL